jgi:predicted TIM-barrel fold metal-dependent hydrolase
MPEVMSESMSGSAIVLESPKDIIDVYASWGPTPFAPKWNDEAYVQSLLTERGIVEAFMASNLARRFETRAGNDRMAERVLAETSPCELRGWLVIHPSQVETSLEQMREYLPQEHFVGALLGYDYVNDRPNTWEDSREILSACRRYGKVLLIEVPHIDAVRYALDIVQNMQGVKVLFSGMGGRDWKQMVDLCTKPTNVFMDTAGVLDPEKLEYAMKVMGSARKMMFASGAPQTDPAAMIGMVEDANIPQADRERIYRTTAQRVFGLWGMGGAQGTLRRLGDGEGGDAESEELP